jgi:NAD(P)-dependent dehydrogenase (short-subunit alcohol dehydrogenase family)
LDTFGRVTLTPEAIRLDDTVAVVTGAAAGIGRAGALALAAHGADVAAIDRDASGLASLAEEVAALGRRCVTHVGDVRAPETIDAFVGATREALGPVVHTLVNNAGGGFRSGFTDINPKGDDALVRENLLSVVWMTRAFVPMLADGASVINVTTVEAHRAAPEFAIYSAAKAGVDQLCRTLALELGTRGIRVNAIAPDLIRTPGIGDLAGARLPPVGRLGDPDDVAGPIVFLASPLSSFMTGSTVHVDGGTLAAAGWIRAGDGWHT